MYVVYRLLVMLYFTTFMILAVLIDPTGRKWFIYVTNWTFLLLFINSCIMSTTAILHYQEMRKKTHHDTGVTSNWLGHRDATN